MSQVHNADQQDISGRLLQSLICMKILCPKFVRRENEHEDSQKQFNNWH